VYQPTASTMRMAPTKAPTPWLLRCARYRSEQACSARYPAGAAVASGSGRWRSPVEYVSKAPIYRARRPWSTRSGGMRRRSHQAPSKHLAAGRVLPGTRTWCRCPSGSRRASRSPNRHVNDCPTCPTVPPPCLTCVKGWDSRNSGCPTCPTRYRWAATPRGVAAHRQSRPGLLWTPIVVDTADGANAVLGAPVLPAQAGVSRLDRQGSLVSCGPPRAGGGRMHNLSSGAR
jgi:hypothetical protein